MKKILSILAVLTLFISFSFIPVKEKKLIVLDAAHGGNDKGAVYDRHTESEISLNIVQLISKLNTNKDIEFVLLRQSDEFISLSDRVEKINKIKPDLVILVHINNAQNKELNGIEVYYSGKNKTAEKSKQYSELLLNHFADSNFSNRGVKEGSFKILRDSDSPALIVECGFLSNQKDREYILTPSGQKETAARILTFVESF